MVDEIREHESFGMLEICRTNGNCSRPLFGSSISCSNTIRMSIHLAEEHRGLHRYWFHARKTLVEIEMSPTQFAEAMTNMNTSGTPVTILLVDGKRMEAPPIENINDVFNKEMVSDFRAIMQDAANLIWQAKDILKAPGTMTRNAKDGLLNLIERIHRNITKNLPFLHEQFAKQMDRTVMEAKGEVDAFVTHTITKLGQAALANQIGVDVPSFKRREKMIELIHGTQDVPVPPPMRRRKQDE